MKLEKIWWYDPMGLAEWQTSEDIQQLEPARCVTIAQVIHETTEWIVTAASWSNSTDTDTEYADVTIIPTGCITKRETLHNTQGDNNGLAH